MEKIKEWVKAHPKLAIGLGVGLLLFFYLLYKNSSNQAAAAANSTTGVDDTGLSSSDYASIQNAEIAAASQQATLQAQAQEQANQQSAQLSAIQTQYAAAVQQTQLQTQAAVQIATLQTGASVDTSAQEATTQQALDTDETQLGTTQSNNQTAVEEQQIQAQATQSTAQTNAINTLVAALTGKSTVVASPVTSTGTPTVSTISPAAQQPQSVTTVSTPAAAVQPVSTQPVQVITTTAPSSTSVTSAVIPTTEDSMSYDDQSSSPLGQSANVSLVIPSVFSGYTPEIQQQVAAYVTNPTVIGDVNTELQALSQSNAGFTNQSEYPNQEFAYTLALQNPIQSVISGATGGSRPIA